MYFETIRMKEAERYFGSNETVLVDLRCNSEYVCGHIPGAYNLPYGEQEEMRLLIEKVRNLVRQKESMFGSKVQYILLYCDRGNVSMLAARDLYNEGFSVINLYGGYHAYCGRQSAGPYP